MLKAQTNWFDIIMSLSTSPPLSTFLSLNLSQSFSFRLVLISLVKIHIHGSSTIILFPPSLHFQTGKATYTLLNHGHAVHVSYIRNYVLINRQRK